MEQRIEKVSRVRWGWWRDRIEAEWVPRVGIGHDPKDDAITVELLAEQGVGGLGPLTLVDRDGHRQMVRLRRSLALPEP